MVVHCRQLQRIQTIAAAYRKDVPPYLQRLQNASADYQKKVERVPGDKRLSMQDIQQAGSEVQQLSSIVVITRHSYWRQARAVLSSKQQTKIDDLLTHATLQDLQ